FMAWLCGPMASGAKAQTAPPVAPTNAVPDSGEQTVDGVAARIEDDVITESEVAELGAFQKLVDGSEKSRDDRIRELADQWMVRGEAQTAQFPQPSVQDVNSAYLQLVAKFPSPEEFNKRCAAVGLTETAVRRMLSQQLYLSGFLDYRFRP